MMLWPQNGLVAVEGRMSAMLSRDGDDHELAPARRLMEAEKAAEEVLGDVLDYRPCGHTIVEGRRYDLAAELNFDQGADGLAFLRTIGGMCPARMRLSHERGPDGQLQTVYVRTARAGVIQQRFYDKGVESGSHPAGQRIRAESQMRPVKSKRQSLGAIGRSDLRSQFIRRMDAYVKPEHDVIAAGPDAALEHLVGQFARDELSAARTERLVGSLAILEKYGRAVYDDRQGRRRLQALRQAGVALEHELPPDRVVPVGKLLREMVEEFGP